MKSHGSLKILGNVRQPDRTVEIKPDGSGSGTIVYECDKANQFQLPKLWSAHPDEPSMVAHGIQLTYMSNDRVQAVYSYSGLTANYSEDNSTIEFDSGCDQVPIQTHPDFQSFAGTPEDPADGAIWLDASTGEVTKKSKNAIFRGWSEGDFAGVESYLITRPIVRKTYLRRSAPNFRKAMSVISNVPGVASPNGIVNWLCLGGSYRKVGGVFQVVEEFKGSPAPGWNKKIYK